MKLGIVIPLKSKVISRNWDVTVAALVETLNSIVNQTNDNYCVAVVGHDIPAELRQQFPNFEFVTVDWDAPNRELPGFSHRDMLIDKGLKIVRGFQTLRDQNVDYWFQLDSDDLLRQDFIEQAQAIKGTGGGVVLGGYFVYKEIDRVITTDEMVIYSGSTFLLAAKHVDIPEHTDLVEEDMKCSPWGRYPHMTIDQFFTDEVKEEFVSLREPILGYVLANGDNISDAWRDTWWKRLKAKLRPYLKGSRFTPSLKKQFGINA